MQSFNLIGVPTIRQEDPMSCWYASAQMVTGTFEIGPIVGMGEKSSGYFQEGLSNGDFKGFAKQNNFVSISDREDDMFRYVRKQWGVSFQNLVYLLNKYGPIWTAIAGSRHIVVVTGVEQKDDVMVIYNDPATGTKRKMELAQFNNQVVWNQDGVMLCRGDRTTRVSPLISLSLGVFTDNDGVPERFK